MMRSQKMPIIFIPKSLREKLGEAGSDALVQVLNEQEKETRDSVIDIAEMRFEKKLGEVEGSLREEITKLDSSLRQEIVKGDSTLREAIQKSKTDTIKWMFLFWIGQIGAILGILLAVFK